MGHYNRQHQDSYGLHMRDDEIDIFELLRTLKNNLWMIIAITGLCTASAIVYSLLATPTYQASAVILAPSKAALNRIDRGAGIVELHPEQEYQRIFQTLINQDLQKRFFFEEIAPTTSVPDTLQSQRALEDFSRDLGISLREKGRNVSHNHIQVTFSSNTPEDAYRTLISFLQFMNERTVEAISDDYLAELETTKKTLEKEIQLRLDSKARNISYEVKRLRESAKLANQLGIISISPQITESEAFQGLSKDDPAMHLLGETFLNSRIKMLESRDNLEAFTPGVAELRAKLNRLTALDLNVSGVNLLTYEKSPTLPHTRVSPRRALITALGLLLGVFMGSAVALVKAFIENHKSRPELAREPDPRRAGPSVARSERLSFALRPDQEGQERRERERREGTKASAI